MQCYDWRKNIFDQSVKIDIKTYDNIRKIATGQREYYTTSCLLDYFSSKENYKIIAIDSSKQEALEVDLKAIQQINFTGHLDSAEGVVMFFILEEVKETVLDFSQGTVKVL